jgi:arabinofuranosyltransferase
MALVTGIGALKRAISERGNERDGLIATLSAGVFLYGGYILWIGGGFLSGRFWAPALFLALLVVAFGSEDLLDQLRAARARSLVGVALGATALVVGLHALPAMVESWPHRTDIHDRSLARMYLKPDLTWGMTDLGEMWMFTGLTHRNRAADELPRYVAVSDVIGIVGLSAGPEVSIVDKLALADPLLAELPLEMPNRWRSGHLPRVIPRGYVHARKTGSLAQMDPLFEAITGTSS